MALENRPAQESFHEKFPNLSHLTPEQQERFLVAHAHNETRRAEEKKTQEALLHELSLPHTPQDTPDKEEDSREVSHGSLEGPKVSTAKKITTNVVDFIPVVGSAKMILEGLRGKQYGTDTPITGKQRIVHTVSGAVFLGLDVTGVGALLSEAGKAALKVGEKFLVKEAVEVGEKVMLRQGEKVVAERGVERGFIQEGEKLVNRGKKRIEKQEQIRNNENPESKQEKKTDQDPVFKDEQLQEFSRTILSGPEYQNLVRELRSSEKERAMNSIATTLQNKKLTTKEIINASLLGAGLYATVPAAVSALSTSMLSFLSPTLAQAIASVAGSSVAGAVLPTTFITSLTTLSTVTMGSLFLSLPLIAQAMIVAPPLFALGYVGTKAYRGIKNIMNERAFKKQFGVSVKDVVGSK